MALIDLVKWDNDILPINKRKIIDCILFSIITFGIYHIIFWNKISKEVNVLCEGDGKKTMKYVFCFLLNIVTVGIFGFIWKYKLAKRLQENAARYDLKFSESGALVVFCSIPGLFLGHFILIKNFYFEKFAIFLR